MGSHMNVFLYSILSALKGAFLSTNGEPYDYRVSGFKHIYTKRLFYKMWDPANTRLGVLQD